MSTFPPAAAESWGAAGWLASSTPPVKRLEVRLLLLRRVSSSADELGRSMAIPSPRFWASTSFSNSSVSDMTPSWVDGAFVRDCRPSCWAGAAKRVNQVTAPAPPFTGCPRQHYPTLQHATSHRHVCLFRMPRLTPHSRARLPGFAANTTSPGAAACEHL